jgi:hypothetical protein
MNDKKGEVIPFGKYKGQPIEILLADTQYRDWLLTKSWFAEKHQTIYNTIINYGAEPTDTPEHNAMQARFLDDMLCKRLIHVVREKHCAEVKDKSPSHFAHIHEREVQRTPYAFGKHPKDRDNILYAYVREHTKEHVTEYYSGRKPKEDSYSYGYHSDKISKYEYDAIMDLKYAGVGVSFSRSFEYEGWDVFLESRTAHVWMTNDELEGKEATSFLGHIRRELGRVERSIGVELKPTVGDDYPTVLRQILKRRGMHVNEYVLIADVFNGKGATLEQVRKMFSESGVTLILFSELSEAVLKPTSTFYACSD